MLCLRLQKHLGFIGGEGAEESDQSDVSGKAGEDHYFDKFIIVRTSVS